MPARLNPLPSGDSTNTCRPSPDTDTSTQIGAVASSTSRAQPARRPPVRQWSKSQQARPLPSMTPNPSPAPCWTSANEAQVSGFVDDAGLPSGWIGRFPSARVHWFAPAIRSGSRERCRFAYTRHFVEQYFASARASISPAPHHPHCRSAMTQFYHGVTDNRLESRTHVGSTVRRITDLTTRRQKHPPPQKTPAKPPKGHTSRSKDAQTVEKHPEGKIAGRGRYAVGARRPGGGPVTPQQSNKCSMAVSFSRSNPSRAVVVVFTIELVLLAVCVRVSRACVCLCWIVGGCSVGRGFGGCVCRLFRLGSAG